MAEPVGYTFHKYIVSFESVLFILLYSFLNLILFISYPLSVFFELSELYLIFIEALIVSTLAVYLEALYRHIGLQSRRVFTKQLFYSSIDNTLLQKVQIFTVSAAILFIVTPIIAYSFELPLFIESSLLDNIIGGLLLSNSLFWITIYYHIFEYKPDVDTSIVEEIEETS